MAKKASPQWTYVIFMIRLFWENVLILSILVFAAFLRVHKIGEYMTFLGDEGRDAIVLYNILHGKLTLLGPTASVGGFFMGPAYYYLVTPFFWLFNYSPVGPSVLVAILSVVTVWLIYKIGSEFFGKKAGLIAAFLYTLSPLVIIYSRSSWNPNVMPFFTILTLYSLYKAIKKQSMLLFLLCGFLFGIDIQLHYTELFLGAVIIAYVVLMHLYKQKAFSWKPWCQTIRDGIYVFIGFVLGFSPFLAFEFRHGFSNSQSILQFIFASGETGASSIFFETLWNVLVRMFGRLLAYFPLPQDFGYYPQTLLTVWYIFTVCIVLLCIGYIVLQYKNSFSEKTRYMQMSLLFLWLIVGIFFFGFYKRSIYDYYFAFLFPLPFLLFGAALADIYDNTLLVSKNNNVRYVRKGLVILVLAIIVGIFIHFSPLKVSPNIQLQKTKNIADFVLSKTDGKPFNFALITGGNSDHGYRYFFIRAGREPVVIQNPMIDPKRKTTTDQLLVICDSLPCSPLGNPLWEIAGFGRARITGHWKVAFVEVYKLVPYQQK